jgi:hypothetical protein
MVPVCLALFVLASFSELSAGQTPLPQQDAESLEQRKLQEFGLPGDLRRKLDSALMAEITEIDRTCRLTPDQRKKLRLMGQGDIQHFFTLLRASKSTPGVEIGPDYLLRFMVDGGLFHESSLFFKSLPNILNTDQVTLHTSRIQKARQERQQGAIKVLLQAFDGQAPLTPSEGKQLTALMNEIRPAGNSGEGAAIYLAFQLGVMAEKHGDRFPNEKCREKVNELVKQVRPFEPVLRQAGYFPPEEDQVPAGPAGSGQSNKK